MNFQTEWEQWKSLSVEEKREGSRQRERERNRIRRANPEVKERRRECDKTRRATPECKECTRERDRSHFGERALRNRYLFHHAPPWLSDMEWAAMEALHIKKRELKSLTNAQHDVDHIFPLFGYSRFNQRISSGLHVLINLQILAKRENDIKGNLQPEGTGFDSPCTDDQIAIFVAFEAAKEQLIQEHGYARAIELIRAGAIPH
jgi:hypothetical protein